MIITVTPNPSLDLTLEVDRFLMGEVNRASNVTLDPGGKGINVARALRAWGVATLAVAPYGGTSGTEFLELLTAEGVPLHGLKTASAVRVNVSIDSSGANTKINSLGTDLTADELAELKDLVSRVASGGRWLALCGSLTPGTPASLFADLIAGCNVPAAVDSSGEPLILALKAGVDLAKPNVHELAGAVGWRLETVGDVVAAAEQVRSWGCRTVVVSLGADGAVLVSDEGVTWAQLERPLKVASAVGAGDALLAATLAGGQIDRAAVVRGVAAGAAACLLPGTTMPTKEQVDAVTVTSTDDPDLSIPLIEPGVPA